jgi:hypothetical protein
MEFIVVSPELGKQVVINGHMPLFERKKNDNNSWRGATHVRRSIRKRCQPLIASDAK